MPTIDYARTLGRPLRLDRVPTLVARTNGAPIAFGLLDSAAPHDAEPMPYDDAFLVCLPLRTASRRLRAGNTLLCDLTCTPQIYAEPPLRAIHAYLPYAALDALAYRAGRPRIQALRGEPGVGVDDATIRHLCLSLLPQFDAPERADPMLIDHVALALAGHVARTYGERRCRVAAFAQLASALSSKYAPFGNSGLNVSSARVPARSPEPASISSATRGDHAARKV